MSKSKASWTVSIILGVYILGKLLYHAKDIPECDFTPLGLSGVFQIMVVLSVIWIAGFLSGKSTNHDGKL